MADEPIPFRPKVVNTEDLPPKVTELAVELTEEMADHWKEAMLDCLTDGGQKGGLVLFRDNRGVISCNAAGWDIVEIVGALTIALDSAMDLAKS